MTREIAEIWQCTCGRQLETPIPVTAMGCPNVHKGRTRVVRIWSKGDGTPPPPKET